MGKSFVIYLSLVTTQKMKQHKLLNGKSFDYLTVTKAISNDYKFPIDKWDFETASVL